MNVCSVGRRSASCLKLNLRRVRLSKTTQRCIATEVQVSQSSANAFSRRQRDDIEKTTRFHVWPQVQSIRQTYPDPMPTLRKQHVSELDPSGARTRLFSKEHADSAKVGDVLMVTTKSGEPFSGAFIQIRRRGVDTAIQLRGQLMKVGVELWFKIYSPTVTAIDIVWRRPKRARRARLTYMRKPKHDMGNVDKLVMAWKQERYSLRSRSKAGGGKKQQQTQKE